MSRLQDPTYLTVRAAVRSVLVAAVVFVGAPCGAAPAPVAVVRGSEVVLSGAGYQVRLSRTDGSILAVRAAAAGPALWHSGEDGLWQARFQDGSVLRAIDFGKTPQRLFDCRVAGGAVVMTYRCDEASVSVRATPEEKGVRFAGAITPARGVVLEFALPARLRFAPAAVRRFICPMDGNQSVGTAWTARFFAEQPADHPAAWRSSVGGTGGYETLFGGPLDQRPVQDPPTALSVTPDGKAWLGPMAARVQGSQAVVNRPSFARQLDIVLADSANGPYFGASHLGGKGWLWRIGGGVADPEKGVVTDLVGAALDHLAEGWPAGSEVGVLSLDHGPQRGGWAAVSPAEWLTRARAIPAAAAGRVKVVAISSPSDALAALRAGRLRAIVNPYGEWLPTARDGGLTEMVEAIRDYVRGGGSWFETAGYSFYAETRPVRYFTYGNLYPDAFADFLQLDATGGTACVYRLQPRDWAPWAGAKRRDAIFVPGRLAVGADVQGGYCDRPFATFVRAGETFAAPAVRMAIGLSAEQNLRDYCAANGIGRRLPQKMAATTLARFKQSILLFLAGSAQQKTRVLDKLPVPTLVHFSDYLHGGFDKQYPDHLPPNAGFGTPEDMTRLFQRAHELGLLVMPYTNPTWWCDHPRGPTFEKEGEAPLLRGLDGQLSYEKYAANDGYTICHWHPAVQEANRRTVRQFSRDYPVDILFQDQCGARGWRYDTNPASPTVYAYTEGLLSQVDEDARIRPLSTESGWDRVVNGESQLCGLTWSIVPTENGPEWRTLMKYEYPPETWNVFPLAEYIAHDKAAMLYHDLGQFVTNRETLAWALGLGFSLSYRAHAEGLGNPRTVEWMRWLDRLQKSVCARYVGQPLLAFRHDRGPAPTVADDGLMESDYGAVRLAVNLGPGAKRAAGRVLPPFGFAASGPGLLGGDLADGEAFVAERSGNRTDVWVYGPGQRAATVPVPAGVSGSVTVSLEGGKPQRQTVRAGSVRIELPPAPGESVAGAPAALAGKAPVDWPGGAPAIGVLSLGAGVGQSWTRVTPAEWVAALKGSRAASLGAPVREIRDAGELQEALKAGPTRWLCIVNPYGEVFPEARMGGGMEMLDAIRQYVRNGGVWWETGGHSFYVATYRTDSGGWARDEVGSTGSSRLGLQVGYGEVDEPAQALHATAAGREWLGAALAERVSAASSMVNRGLLASADAPPRLTLVAGARQDFIGGYRLGGWGWLFRVGGFWPVSDVVTPVVVAATDYVYTHPPLPTPPGAPHLWHAVIR